MSTIHQLNDTGTGTDAAAADLIPAYDASAKTPVNFRVDQLLRGNSVSATADSTAGALTITAAMVLAGILVRDPNGAGRTDTLPTAALLVAAMSRPAVGDVLRLKIINGADAAETITIAAGSGGAFDSLQIAATRIIPQNTSRDVWIRLTNVTASSEAYVVYM